MAKTNFINPSVGSSDEDEVMVDETMKKDEKPATQPPKKNLDKELFDDSEDDGDIEGGKSKEPSPVPRKRPRCDRKAKMAKKKRKTPVSGSDDSDFQPEESEEDDAGEDDDDDDASSGVKSENMTDEAISDSDFEPDSEAEEEEPDKTIDLSSDSESPKKETTQTFDPNSKEFWNKVEELKNKGFSIQQTSATTAKANGASKNGQPPRGRPPPPPQGAPFNNKLSAFTQLYMSFEHEKRCLKKCFMMEGKQKQTLKEINSPYWLTPDFIKACIRVVQCCVRIGDVATAREGIQIINEFGDIPGVSALSQAMISGCKVHQDNMDSLEKSEREAMEAMKNKEFSKALELLDKVLEQASGCIRAKMTRGDCLAHLGRYVDGAKAASSILVHDQKNVGALFLRGFCLYHKDNIDRAMTHFQQVLQINKDHSRAKALLQKSRQYREKKEQGIKASNNHNIDHAIRIYNEALDIDPRNKGTNARLLASRAELYAKLKDYKASIADCEKALELDTTCLIAMVQRGKCHMAQENWEQAVRDFERVNNRDRHNQQNKKKAADAALKANHHDEAFRLYQEAFAVDKHNQTYRHLLKTAKQQLAKINRKDLYGVLGIEPSCGESEIRKAYFKKSKEYHPDRHAGAAEEEKEELSNKFKLVKEAYEILSDNQKRQTYDVGEVKPPPGGWYQDLDPKILESVHPRGALRGRGVVRGGIRGMPRGMPVRGGIVVRGNMTGGRLVTRVANGGIRGVPMNVQFRGGVQRMPARGVRGGVPMRGMPMRGMPVRGQVIGSARGTVRGGIRTPMAMNGRGDITRPVARAGVRGAMNGARPVGPGTIRGGLPSSVTITPMSEVTIDD